MVAPKRVSTRTQPIAVDGAARYPAGVLGVAGGLAPGTRHRGPSAAVGRDAAPRRGGARPAAQPTLGRPLASIPGKLADPVSLASSASMTRTDAPASVSMPE